MDSRHGVDVPRFELIAVRWPAALLVAACCLCVGCSTPYRESLPANLTFSAPGLDGSFLSKTSVRLEIFFAESPCHLDYRGGVSIRPGQGPHTIGVPSGQDVYARIFYSHRGFFSSTTRQRTHEYRLHPRPGRHYELRYTSTTRAYETRLLRRGERDGHEVELDLAGWPDCRES